MKVESPAVSVVLVGPFRPAAFSPEFLREKKLLNKDEASNVIYSILIPGTVIRYSFGWGELHVGDGRLQILSREAPFIRVCDFAIRALDDVAHDVAITAFGINREGHYNVGSAEARNKIGVRMAPPEAWGAWGKKILQTMNDDRAGGDSQGGLMNMQMRFPFKDAKAKGYLDIYGAPSSLIPHMAGIFLRANHHHEAADGDPTHPAVAKTRLIDVMAERFDTAINEIEDIFFGVLKQ